MVDEILEEGNVGIIPWLVGDEHKKVAKMDVQIYVWSF